MRGGVELRLCINDNFVSSLDLNSKENALFLRRIGSAVVLITFCIMFVIP